MLTDLADLKVVPADLPDLSVDLDGAAVTTDANDAAQGSRADAAGDDGPETGASCAGKGVLLLGDGWEPSVAAATALLAEERFSVTAVGDYGIDAGALPVTPASFAAVLLLSGHSYPPMSDDLQRALLDAHQKGVGLVFEEWTAYNAFKSSRAVLLAPLMLFVYGGYHSSILTLTKTNLVHPVWAGLPPTFTTVAVTTSGYPDAGFKTGATVIATSDFDASAVDAVLVKDGPGRIAQTTLATNWEEENALANDPSVRRLYLNMVKWVARCSGSD
jgi:hypothetical protein